MHKTIAVMTLAMAGFVLNAQDQPAEHKSDNTAVNKRDRQKGEPTADQQKENATDRDVAKNIRRALMKDKSLSTYAHNVKVISENGSITLKGPVRSEEEKHAVEAKAAEVAGSTNVRSELTVVPKGEKHQASR
ncbi:MAG TPA: BON domain-containing protein [Bryobacteraceae bacterium]|nr:BON domain-containing protein [Bryobacteraceae bacterium]